MNTSGVYAAEIHLLQQVYGGTDREKGREREYVMLRKFARTQSEIVSSRKAQQYNSNNIINFSVYNGTMEKI